MIGCPSEIAEDILDGKYVVCSHCPGCTTLAAMHKLHKISSHPNLIQVDRLDSPAEQKKKLEFAKVALPPDILRDMPGGSYYNIYLMPIIAEDRRMKKVHISFYIT